MMKPGARLHRDLLQLFQLTGKDIREVFQSEKAAPRPVITIPPPRRNLQYVRPAKAGPVGIRRVGADRHTMLQGQRDRLPHRTGIAGMTAAGYIRRTDKGKNCCIRIHAFAHVAIEVNF